MVKVMAVEDGASPVGEGSPEPTAVPPVQMQLVIEASVEGAHGGRWKPGDWACRFCKGLRGAAADEPFVNFASKAR